MRFYWKDEQQVTETCGAPTTGQVRIWILEIQSGFTLGGSQSLV